MKELQHHDINIRTVSELVRTYWSQLGRWAVYRDGFQFFVLSTGLLCGKDKRSKLLRVAALASDGCLRVKLEQLGVCSVEPTRFDKHDGLTQSFPLDASAFSAIGGVAIPVAVVGLAPPPPMKRIVGPPNPNMKHPKYVRRSKFSGTRAVNPNLE